MLAVGEMPFSHDTSVMIPYTLPEANELQMVFQFEIAGWSFRITTLFPLQMLTRSLFMIRHGWDARVADEGECFVYPSHSNYMLR